MNIFGIGFSGYIGEAVVERLLADGHSLRGLARSEYAAQDLTDRGVTPVEGSMADLSVISEECRKADAVYLLSTAGFLTEALGTKDLYGNCVDAILDALEGSNKPFILISGTGFWADNVKQNPNMVLNEDVKPIPPEFYQGLYGPYVKTLEAKDRGIRSIVVIPSQVYGRRGGYIGPIARRFECWRKHGCIHAIYPSQSMLSFVHVDDLADLMVRAMEKAEPGSQYIAVTDTESLLNISRLVSRLVGLDGRLSIVSREELEKLDSWTAIFDFDLVLMASAEKAKSELGWEPKGRGVVDELQYLIDTGINPNSIYPSENRRRTFENIKL